MSLFCTEMEECVCLGYWRIYVAKDMKTIRSGRTGVESRLAICLVGSVLLTDYLIQAYCMQGRDKKNYFWVEKCHYQSFKLVIWKI